MIPGVLPTISYLTDVHFEAGATRRLPQVLESLGARRPLVVTDPGVIAAGILGALPDLHAGAVFDGVAPNPSEDDALAGLQVFQNARCDSVVAVGGGSPMDCAKAIALLATHPPPLEDYAFIRGGLSRITERKPPLVAVPTTAGTGSEVGRGALITFRGGRKLAIVSPKIIPQAAVCDPLLTLALPPLLTAATGLDAISHGVETFLSPRFNPVAEAIALDGIARAVRWLPRAVEQGDDVTARSEMMMAALEGGLTFQKGLGAVHSLSHALGGLPRHRLHHGTLNAILLPHVVRWNAPAAGDKTARLAAVLDLHGREDAAEGLARLASSLGLPPRLRDLGVSWEEVQGQVPRAAEDHCCATNPRPLDAAALRELLRAAY